MSEELGKYLREARHKKNLSLREAAKRIGMSSSRLQEIEASVSKISGKLTKPKPSTLSMIASTYNLPEPMLLDMSGYKKLPDSTDPPSVKNMDKMNTLFSVLNEQYQTLLIRFAEVLLEEQQRGSSA